MQVSIYLHSYIVEVLTTFGTLHDTINRLVDETIDETDIASLPPAPPRDDATRYSIDITNETYRDTVNIYGPNSIHCSIRRLIYWFVDNEVFEQLEWQPVKYNDKVKKYLKNKIADTKTNLNKIRKSVGFDEKQILNKIDELIIELEGIINGEQNK